MVFKKENSQINDLIFRELIKRGYSLEGNTRIWNIADSKLWYLTPEQAQAYLDLEESQDYKKDTGQPQGEDLIQNNAKEILDLMGNESFNIIDLGCGDGKKAFKLVLELKKVNPLIKIRYCPVDISGYMVEKAKKTFSSSDIDKVIEFQYNISDFENLDNIIPLLRKNEFKNNLILLLGNTLGNFEIHELLYGIRSNMKEDDLFVVDTAIDDKKQKERVLSYKNNKRANDWLIKIPMQLGLKDEDVEIGFRWNNPRIEGYYTIKNDKKVKFQNKEVNFLKGDQIIIIVAYKHELEDIKSYLNIHFNNVNAKVSSDYSKILALCRK
ncbi:MAG: L-histidine N(alpha)-methyltransferase [Nanoarchaeota archaeon]|nr:L-histidine N(alpha)-methyltransferase [Nanoarchaeota archaeon]